MLIYSMNIWKNPSEKSSFSSADQLWLISLQHGFQADWHTGKSSRSSDVEHKYLLQFDKKKNWFGCIQANPGL